MKAREIMTVSVATVRPDTPIREAAALLTEHAVASLPVLDEDGRVIGIVSEVDLICNRLPHDPRSHLRSAEPDQTDPACFVREVMSHVVVCRGGDTDTADLATAMSTNNVRAVPIVDGSRLVGIVSRRDLLGTLLRDDAAMQYDVRARVEDYSGSGTRWSIFVDDGVATIRGHFDGSARQEIITQLARTVPGILRVHTIAEEVADRPQAGAGAQDADAWRLFRRPTQWKRGGDSAGSCLSRIRS